MYLKIVSIINRLTPRFAALAFWTMDDGSFNKSKGYLILCTDSYSKEDVLYLTSILETKFNLSSSLFMVQKNKKFIIEYELTNQQCLA